MTNAVVVGSGPNGLAAALTLAEQGIDVRVLEAAETIGGGARTSELTLPGLLHDDCSAFHPAGVASPFLRGLGLEEYGLRWRWPEIQLAHPLDSGRAGLMWQDVDRTADGLGADGAAWTDLLGRLATDFDALIGDLFRPVLHLPGHPYRLARFGLEAMLPATWIARRWHTDEARGLFGGVAAHLFGRLDTPLSSPVGLMLAAAGHAHGWPVAEGGSSAIVTAMARRLAVLGGTIETGVEVTSAHQFGDPDLVMLDIAPDAARRLVGDRMPKHVERRYRRYELGPAAYKVDLAIEGEVPWTNPDIGRAGTVHLGGPLEEIADVEAQVVRGSMPARPFVLLGQQYVADPSRSSGGLNPLYAYAHVPHGYRGDATSAVLAQIERFAPGFGGRIRQVGVRDPSALEAYDANYVGGDISIGRNTPWQLLMGPRAGLRPYETGVPGVYLCSSATPPGAGVHGMCGFNAATAALRNLR